MNSLLLGIALATSAGSTGEVRFVGAVYTPTCTYHHDAGGLDARNCYQATKPTVIEPTAHPDPATLALMDMNIPTWRLIYR